MKRVVRIGRIEDQDQFRREDCLRMTPEERVMLVFAMQRRHLGTGRARLRRVASVRRLDGARELG
ncbi:MAG: hypothetical protein A3K19_28350 [Lentisphaerae bacterium RIFOXYB12_FULL_65_16]|nr:MAG: hypothetical protein A3K18_19600 [Lentisphaerae bacterium RIFOXYA12_64_32]OGV85499.1 MAG: hypothetical protein A3K19_28350 [Lentisphaerae bacterium RIFOXYB12_FULL_65_16]